MSGEGLAPRLSALVVAHDEEAHLPGCLDSLVFADEIVVVLDRCADRSPEIAHARAHKVLEGAWEIEGERRNLGLEACTGDWILEVDADERVSPDLAREVRQRIADAPTPGHFLVPFDNYIGDRLIRDGWGPGVGVRWAPRLSSKGGKRWGAQRVHPSLELPPLLDRLSSPMVHLVDRDISDLLARLDRYSTQRAADLRSQWRDGGRREGYANNLRRMVSRFLKAYISRKGYREGGWGLLLALFAALYPMLAYLKARLEPDG